jgi:hypothetical protein
VTAVPGFTELTRYEVGDEYLIEPFQFSTQCSVAGTRIEVVGHTEETFTASVNRRDAVEWINAQMGPFFAYVNFNPPHFPYQVPPLALLSQATRNELANAANCAGPYCAGQEAGEVSPCGTDTCGDFTGCLETQEKLFYNVMLEAIDTEIGNLLAQMSPAKRANTIVFLVADNGTPAVAIEEALHDPDHGKGQLYELGVRVPMIAAGYLIPVGAHVSQALVHGVDLWRTVAQVSGASETLAAPLQPLDSVGFKHVLRNPDAPGLRDEIFCQTFVQPGPYELDCADPQVPGVFACVPQNVGPHGRSACDGQYKLLLIQTTAGGEVAPVGSEDLRPEYVEELYDILADPAETNDLMPLVPGDPTLAAIRDGLRARLTALSGF